MEREYIRDRTLESHQFARKRGKAIGGATVADDAMLSMALHLREHNHCLRDIAIPDEKAAHTPKNDTFGPSWWIEDAERWDLLRFEAAHDEAGLPLDRWWKDRKDVLEALILTPGPVDHDFARFLLDQEMRFHRHCWGFSHTIEVAVLLLAEHRRPDDVWHLWQAITTSFDTWCGLPHRLLLAGGGTTRTIAHVVGYGHEQQDNLLGHLQELPPVTGDDVTALLAERRRYYADVLRELGTSTC